MHKNLEANGLVGVVKVHHEELGSGDGGELLVMLSVSSEAWMARCLRKTSEYL